MKVKRVIFEYEADSDIEIVIDAVPKSIMKAIGNQFNLDTEFEGVTESLNIALHGVKVRLCRIAKSDDLIKRNGP